MGLWSAFRPGDCGENVGCGVGGSSRHIAKKFGASGVGISLSPFHIQTALELTEVARLDKHLNYVVEGTSD